MNSRMIRHLTLTACLAIMTGCGGPPQADYSELGLVDVEGTIKLDGQPVAFAVVGFVDAKTGSESVGLTDQDGNYRLQFDSKESGTMPGEKTVVVSTTRVVPGLNGVEGGNETGEEAETEADDGAMNEKTELIPEAYRRDSKLTVTIGESSQTVNFDLASDGSTTGPVD